MSKVRCPACGRSNPEGANICQYCQADLNPAEVEADSIRDGTSSAPGSPAGQSDRSIDRINQGQRDPEAGEETRDPGEQALPESGGEAPPVEAPPDQETAGPLSGLMGLLSADRGTTRAAGQATRPLHLKVTASQRLHAELLQSLIEEEGQVRPLLKRPAVRSHRMQRWIIACLLLAAILWPVWMGMQPAAMDIYTEEAAELNRLVGQLPPGAKVLVAFDYEPAYAAEMEAAAAPVLDHIMLSGANLAIASTSPSGPLLAERLLQSQLSEHGYLSGNQYANMGYIPGGAAGLLSLVESPQRTIPYTIDGIAAWESADNPALPPFQGVRSLEDFSMVLVLADDPEVVRSWIEQVSSRLAEQTSQTSLVMVTSAQVEPLLYPYYDESPRQLHGFISGLRGGSAYTLMTGRDSQAELYWDVFGVGVFVIAVILVVGAVLHAATGPNLAAGSRSEPR